jgi:hypothetical protein
MQRVLLPVITFFSVVVLSACASARVGLDTPPTLEPAVDAANSAQIPPVLLGCSSYAGDLAVYTEQVYLSYVVDERGQVEPSSIRVEPSQPFADGLRRGPSQASAFAVTAAKGAALSCSYRAARVGDHPVRTRVVERFTF